MRGVVEGLGREASSEAEIAPRVLGGANGLYCRARPWAEGEVGLFESFPFLSVGRRLWAFVGPIAQHVFCILRVI